MCGYYSRQDALVYARLNEGTDGLDSGLEAIKGKQLKGPRSIYLAGRHIFEYVRSSFIPYAHVHAIARLACGALNFANVGNAPINSPAFVSAIRKS